MPFTSLRISSCCSRYSRMRPRVRVVVSENSGWRLSSQYSAQVLRWISRYSHSPPTVGGTRYSVYFTCSPRLLITGTFSKILWPLLSFLPVSTFSVIPTSRVMLSK